jgi:hypothetical protein
MKMIPLSGEKGAGRYVIVDDCDHELLSQYRWYLHAGYASGGSVAQRELGHTFMHRIINQTPDGMDTDHINHDTLDNQRSNLRSVTRSQNLMNAGKHKGKASKYKGVWLKANIGMWGCAIAVNGESINLGCHKTQRSAALAYNEAAIRYFGEYANVNDIPEHDPDDKPIMKRWKQRGGKSPYAGVFPRDGGYMAFATCTGKKTHIGMFPDETFAARIHDAFTIQVMTDEAIRHVNFPELIDEPLDLGKRYVFKARPRKNTPYAGVKKNNSCANWYAQHDIDGKRKYFAFDNAIDAAEHYDKLVLIHRDDLCTLLNFPEKLDEYLSEIGNQIISPKKIELVPIS